MNQIFLDTRLGLEVGILLYLDSNISFLLGSLFADLEELIYRAYTKEDYTNKKPLPDWTNFIDNYKVPKVHDLIQRENVVQIRANLSSSQCA